MQVLEQRVFRTAIHNNTMGDIPLSDHRLCGHESVFNMGIAVKVAQHCERCMQRRNVFL
jgi:hypothetical protein